MQILDSKYKILEGKVLNMEKHLDNKCDKQKCKKIFHKMNKIETKFMNKFLMLMREVTEIDESKCSTAKCQEIEAKMTNISSQVEAVTGDTTIVTSVPGVTPQSIAEIHTIIGELKEDKCSKSSCEKMESDIEILNTDNTAIQDDLKNIENHIEDLDNTKCSKSNCEKIASDITALQGDIDRIEEEKCDGRLCEEIAESIGGLCDRQECENTAIGLSNLGEVVASLYTTQEEMLQELVNSKLALENVTSCMREPSLPVCTVEYGTAGLTAQLQGVTSCLSDPSSSSCSTTFPQSSSLPAVLSSKCSSSVCSSLESCFTQPGGDQCRDSYGSDVAPLGLVSLIPNIQTWIEVLRDPPKLQCSKTTNTLPGKSPTEGPEIWLVSFDECQDFQSDGGEGAIKPLFDNSFFEVNTSGEFFVSLTYLPVVIGGKPLRVSGSQCCCLTNCPDGRFPSWWTAGPEESPWCLASPPQPGTSLDSRPPRWTSQPPAPSPPSSPSARGRELRSGWTSLAMAMPATSHPPRKLLGHS